VKRGCSDRAALLHTAKSLERARQLASTGQDEAAKTAYLELLSRDPTHFSALNELGTVALATGHRSAARTAYRQAVHCHPNNPVGRVNLGNLYFQDGDLAAAHEQYQAALDAAKRMVLRRAERA
jgi:Flp pilus assembly protein TadD